MLENEQVNDNDNLFENLIQNRIQKKTIINNINDNNKVINISNNSRFNLDN